jgi:hypothetical protein
VLPVLAAATGWVICPVLDFSRSDGVTTVAPPPACAWLLMVWLTDV